MGNSVKDLVSEITKIAVKYGWDQIDYQSKSSLISFEKSLDSGHKPVKMNVYYKVNSSIENLNLTVGTAMNHPKQGNTQLFRKNVDRNKLIKLFKNPRKHTSKGYYKK